MITQLENISMIIFFVCLLSSPMVGAFQEVMSDRVEDEGRRKHRRRILMSVVYAHGGIMLAGLVGWFVFGFVFAS